MPAQLGASVLICTYNRAERLAETLDSIHGVISSRPWDITVVDNNSSDHTRQVVERFAASSRIPTAYVFEPMQGKSHALNTGLARVRGALVVFTDDDVRVAPRWLDEACAPMETAEAVDYTGGPVRPLWGAVPPPWFDATHGDLWGTLAILDYGPDTFVFEEQRKVPLGVNMAIRRSLIDRIGGFHPELGRRGGSLLGQEQAEFLARGRALGLRGQYVPGMEVWHHVPSERLTKVYFCRWWHWKGISRARVDAIHLRTELGLDLAQVPHIASVPRFVWGAIPRDSLGWVRCALAGDPHGAMRHGMHLAYASGYIRGCWSRERLSPIAPVALYGKAASLPR